MRELHRDDYAKSEIAFMFECKEGTVATHIDRDCHHQQDRPSKIHREYSDSALLDCYETVYHKQPYERMSQACYENYRDDEMPSSSTIHRRFGSWPKARELVWGESDG